MFSCLCFFLGRRRRTELEELKRWSVVDHANSSVESKHQLESCPVSVSDREILPTKDSQFSSSSNTEMKSMKNADNKDVNEFSTDYGGFTEPMVERVKLRRQQQTLETSMVKSTSSSNLLRQKLDSHSTRSVGSRKKHHPFSFQTTRKHTYASKTKPASFHTSDTSLSSISTDLSSIESSRSDVECMVSSIDAESSSKKILTKHSKDNSAYKSSPALLSSLSPSSCSSSSSSRLFKTCDFKQKINLSTSPVKSETSNILMSTSVRKINGSSKTKNSDSVSSYSSM